MSYTYQNLMGWRKLKTRQIRLQHIQNSNLNELSRNYVIIYKSEKIWGNWNKLATLRIRSLMNYKETKGWNVYEILIPKWWDIDRLRLLSSNFWNWLTVWVKKHYSWGSGFDPFCCQNFGRNMWKLRIFICYVHEHHASINIWI